MSLDTRKKDFEMFQDEIFDKISPLIVSSKINKKLLNSFNNSVIKYLSKSATNSYKLKSEKSIINFYDRNIDKLNFITPNGAVVPKKETAEEFNLITKIFIKIIKSLNIQSNIVRFHIPLNIRVKFSNIPSSYYLRDRATEKPHSDSWAGESSNCVNFHIPIFGDVDNNKMEFFYPKKLNENWLRPLKNFQTGFKYKKYYKRLNFKTSKGNLIISDFATLHRTIRKKNCKTRVSLDTTFEIKRTNKFSISKIHKDRKNEYISFKKYEKLGDKNKYYFSDSIFNLINQDKGFKHFANFRIVKNEKYKS